ncbi:MAG: hypothetical protein K2Q34_01445 [Alphaproteobacteria bacterium]|nr:hypothetical protein [Alphaproteobacteria bacterium]
MVKKFLRTYFLLVVFGIVSCFFSNPTPANGADYDQKMEDEDGSVSTYNWVSMKLKPYPKNYAESSLREVGETQILNNIHHIRLSPKYLFALGGEVEINYLLYHFQGWPNPPNGVTREMCKSPNEIIIEQLYETPTTRKSLKIFWTTTAGVTRTQVRLEDGPWINEDGSKDNSCCVIC